MFYFGSYNSVRIKATAIMVPYYVIWTCTFLQKKALGTRMVYYNIFSFEQIRSFPDIRKSILITFGQTCAMARQYSAVNSPNLPCTIRTRRKLNNATCVVEPAQRN